MKLRSYRDYRSIYHWYSYATIVSCGLGTLSTRLSALGGPKIKNDLTILTFSIFPECTRIWYAFMKKAVDTLAGESVDAGVLIVDCSGKLNPKHFPGTRVIKYMNDTHPHKLDFFIFKYIGSRYVWISDDDCFVFDPDLPKQALERMKQNAKLAVSSFMPRRDWWFTIGGGKVRPMGSYCLVVEKDIIERERLSFLNLSIKNSHNNRTYDTADYMNEQLLSRGYEIRLPPEQTRDRGIGGFKGSSIWKALEWGCSKNELERYFREPFSWEYHVRHNFKAFYIAAKVYGIYQSLFGASEWKPVFSVEEMRDFLKTMKEGDIKTGIMEDLEWVESCNQDIENQLNSIR